MENTEASIEVQKPTEVPQKKERSSAQTRALEAARAKAFAVRAENAELRRKEKAIDKKAQEEMKLARKAKVEAEYSKVTKEPPKEEIPKEETNQEEQEEIEYIKAPKKTKKRRVVVVQDSSSEDEVEVVLPKQKKKEPEVDPEYSRMYDKLFSMH